MRYLSIFLLMSFLGLGCSAVPLESPSVPQYTSRIDASYVSLYQTYAGVIHVHSQHSDGRLNVAQIAKKANRQDLDFLIFTEHNSVAIQQGGEEGMYGNTLVLAGNEVSTSKGHYIALNTPEPIEKYLTPEQTQVLIDQQGGLGFLAHPHWDRSPWKDFRFTGMDGLEIYNAADDLTSGLPIWMGLATLVLGADFGWGLFVDRPDKSLAYWDKQLLAGRRLVGIAGADAHGHKFAGLHFGPYHVLFKLARTYAVLPKNTRLSPDALYAAIGQGHVYVAHASVADPGGFEFVLLQEGQVVSTMGDVFDYGRGLQLYTYLPSPGKIRLFKDGQVIYEAKGQQLVWELTGPGIYRVEGTKKGKPWIYSNPIYIE